MPNPWKIIPNDRDAPSFSFLTTYNNGIFNCASYCLIHVKSIRMPLMRIYVPDKSGTPGMSESSFVRPTHLVIFRIIVPIRIQSICINLSMSELGADSLLIGFYIFSIYFCLSIFLPPLMTTLPHCPPKTLHHAQTTKHHSQRSVSYLSNISFSPGWYPTIVGLGWPDEESLPHTFGE